MSSHYIFLSCTYPSCDVTEGIYTGNVYTDEFSDDLWEGETIHIPCKKHEKEEVD